MLDQQDLKDFLNLPDAFKRNAETSIKCALIDFDNARAIVVQKLEDFGGEDGFKDKSNYKKVIKWLKSREHTLTNREKSFALAALDFLWSEHLEKIDLFAECADEVNLTFAVKQEARRLMESLVANFFIDGELSFNDACANALHFLPNLVEPNSRQLCCQALFALRNSNDFKAQLEGLRNFHQRFAKE